MFVLQQLLVMVIAPAGLALALLLGLGRPWRALSDDKLRALGAALAIAIGYTLSHGLISGWPGLPPVDVTHWLLWFALAGALLGALDVALAPPTALRLAVRGIVSLGAVYLLLTPLFKWTFASTLISVLWTAGLTGGLFVVWTLIDGLLRGHRGLAPVVALVVIAGGSSAALGLGASTMLAQLAFVVTATLGAAGLVALLWPSFALSHAAAPVISLLFFGLWLNGYFYAELGAVSGLALVLAPVAVFGAAKLVQTRFTNLGRFKAAFALGGAALLLVGIALAVLALRELGASTGAEESLYDYY